MEKKTIGGFIAALRKANGMTQKELAEKLNVSDKSVSRWERDDGAPDLSLIPVIAEIFGVTCDELLRGERKPAGERTAPAEEEYTPKAEKQRQRLLKISLSQYKSRSVVAVGVALAGLIAAMVGNFAFNRAYLGFLVGAVFYLAAAVCQSVFVGGALLSVSDDSLSEAELGAYKRDVLFWAEAVYGLILSLLAASLPLILMVHDAYAGLSMGAWGSSGLICGAFSLAAVVLVCYFLNAALLKRGVYGRKNEERYWHNHKLKRICVLFLAGLQIATFAGHYAATAGFNAYHLAERIVFEDYDSFAAYMEQPVPYRYSSAGAPENTTAVEPMESLGSEPTYYNEFGVQITEEEANTRELRDKNGEVVCTYVHRNEMVASVRYAAGDGTVLPITVVTYDALREGGAELRWRSMFFIAAYCLELAAVVVLYFKKRAK